MIPPEANAGFVAAMEDVMETYQRPSDPERPLVCLDETSKQLIAETRTPIPAKPGRPALHDYEYERNGVANLFMYRIPPEFQQISMAFPPAADPPTSLLGLWSAFLIGGPKWVKLLWKCWVSSWPKSTLGGKTGAAWVSS